MTQLLLLKQIFTVRELKDLSKEGQKLGKSLEQLLIEGDQIPPEKHQKCVDVIHEYQFSTLHRQNEQVGKVNNGNKAWQELQSLIELHSKEALFDENKESALIKIVDFLLHEGCGQGASDIHIEPERNYTVVRLRIDGVMHDAVNIPPTIYGMIISRIKIMAKLRTDEHQIPQDGKIHYDYDGMPVDIRVSILPTIKGENVVMRILSSSNRNYTLENLGFSKKDYESLSRYVKKPWGMILVTGPTGSGKTTTLYSILQILNQRESNIITIEDPVEYYIEGITQIQVNPKAGLTFASGLRSIVRQDPNIVMVGEIRDEETADISINAGMTGHLVLSTLHTNDAPTAIPRFMEMKVQPFLIASTINVIVAQRLVRKICESCRISYSTTLQDIQLKLPDMDVAKLLPVGDTITFYKGTGCEACKKTGYAGRIGIFEVLEMMDEIRVLIMKNADSDMIREEARKQGMTMMYEDAFRKVLAGITTIEDVIRVIK